jgi:hypothetical protein
MLHLQLCGELLANASAVWMLVSFAMIEGPSWLWSGVGVTLPGDAPRFDLIALYPSFYLSAVTLAKGACHRADSTPVVFRYTLGGMADDAEMRLRARRDYIRIHTQARRDVAREKGDRRLDVTLKGEALDNYATVRRYIEATELSPTVAPRRRRISDVYVINWALKTATDAIRQSEEEARHQVLAPSSAKDA